MIKKLFAEFAGTFFIVFFGTGAIVFNTFFNGILNHLAISAIFGLAVTLMIILLGNVSGAHFNPAVSFGFYLAGRFNKNLLFPFIISQLLGAISASLALKFIYPTAQTLGNTFVFIPIYLAFFIEGFISFLLMSVILWSAKGSWESGLLTAISIGFTVFLLAFVAGSFTGASMNPARSLGPAVVSGNYTHILVYLTAPFLGVFYSTVLFKKIFK